MNKTTIVIGDLHDRIHWIEEALSNLVWDRVIFLGDYFDSLNDQGERYSPEEEERRALATANWLKKSIQDDRRVHLAGNHDLSYAFPNNRYVGCPGWRERKQIAINKVFGYGLGLHLQMGVWDQNWLLTHAGIHPAFAIHPILGLMPDRISVSLEEAKLNVASRQNHELVFKGIRNKCPGPAGVTWMDWYEEFQPIEGLNQIVGHTRVREMRRGDDNEMHWTIMDEPACKKTDSSENWNLDCGNHSIGIIENGQFTWIDNSWL